MTRGIIINIEKDIIIMFREGSIYGDINMHVLIDLGFHNMENYILLFVETRTFQNTV